MANVGYVNKAVRAMYGIPLSQLTPKQRAILKKDGERRAKLIAERQKEVMRDNRKAFEDEAQFERVLTKLYQQSQDKILADVTKVIAEVEGNGGVWSYANQSALTRSKGLFDQINAELGRLGVKEVKAFNSFLTNEYTEQFTRALFTLGQTMPLKGEGAFAMLNPRLVQDTLNYPWSGAMFSDRLWIDKERLGRNLRTGLTQSMVLGEGIPQITKRISNGIETSKYNAERIARTETKRVCYTSQEAAWESQGIEELRYMTAGNGTGANICDVCRECHNKVYKLGEEPTLPRHPNCRCWYVPLTPDTFKPGELNELTNSVRGAENYEKWMEANRDKLNPDGTLKEGWVRDWKNGGKLVYDPNRLKDDRVFRYHSVEEYQKRISEMEGEIKDLQDQKLATTGVLKGIYTPEEKGYTDISSVAKIDKEITLKMKELETDQIKLTYEMRDFKTNPPKPPVTPKTSSSVPGVSGIPKGMEKALTAPTGSINDTFTAELGRDIRKSFDSSLRSAPRWGDWEEKRLEELYEQRKRLTDKKAIKQIDAIIKNQEEAKDLILNPKGRVVEWDTPGSFKLKIPPAEHIDPRINQSEYYLRYSLVETSYHKYNYLVYEERLGGKYYIALSGVSSAKERNAILAIADDVFTKNPRAIGAKLRVDTMACKKASSGSGITLGFYEPGRHRLTVRNFKSYAEIYGISMEEAQEKFAGTVAHEFAHIVHSKSPTLSQVTATEAQWQSWKDLIEPYYDQYRKGKIVDFRKEWERMNYPVNAEDFYRDRGKNHFYQEMWAESTAIVQEHVSEGTKTREVAKLKKYFPKVFEFITAFYAGEV